MSNCSTCGGLIPLQGLMTGVTLPFCKCERPTRVRDNMRPMSFADIQEMFDVTLTEDPEGAERLIQLVRMIEKFHGIG